MLRGIHRVRFSALYLIPPFLGGLLIILLTLNAVPFDAVIAIFLVSIAVFSVLAVRHSQSPFWRYVDYFWVSSTVLTILINASSSSTDVNRQNLINARRAFRASLAEVIFQLDGTVDRYCRENSTTPPPGPGDLYSCKRMRHMLYQVNSDYRVEAIQDEKSSQFPQNWAADFCLKQLVPGHEQWGVYSKEGPLCPQSEKFDSSFVAMTSELNKYKNNKSFLDSLRDNGSIKYWYYLYAILAALRLSRVTADIAPRFKRAPVQSTTDQPTS